MEKIERRKTAEKDRLQFFFIKKGMFSNSIKKWISFNGVTQVQGKEVLAIDVWHKEQIAS